MALAALSTAFHSPLFPESGFVVGFTCTSSVVRVSPTPNEKWTKEDPGSDLPHRRRGSPSENSELLCEPPPPQKRDKKVLSWRDPRYF